MPAPGYKFFLLQLNTLEDRSWVGSKSTFTLVTARRFFASERLQDKLARALGAEGVLPVKEVLECCEFFERIREHTRAEVVADLCCGHGLLGLLFAMFSERDARGDPERRPHSGESGSGDRVPLPARAVGAGKGPGPPAGHRRSGQGAAGGRDGGQRPCLRAADRRLHDLAIRKTGAARSESPPLPPSRGACARGRPRSV